jgi:hypothetical protein
MTIEIVFKNVSNFSSKILLIQTLDSKKQSILWSKEIQSIKKLDTPVLVYQSLNELLNFILETASFPKDDFHKELQKAIDKIHPKYLNKTYRMFLEDFQRNVLFTSIYYLSILNKSSLKPS